MVTVEKRKLFISISLKIVDENIDLKCINFGDNTYDDDDEAPIIAEVIDERPLEVKLKELYESSRWKKVDNNASMKPEKTLSGLKAGLQSSETLKKEIQELRKREKAHINMLDDDVSGKNSVTIVRDRKTGKKRDLQREKKMKDEENKKSEKHQQKYAQWGKGIEQEQNKINKFEEDIYEMSKPLQRYRDDKDLDNRLKSIMHAEDPIANYIKKKMQKNISSVPTYNGPPAPPNRFDIPPGYRWDGVNRSNGFERKLLSKH